MNKRTIGTGYEEIACAWLTGHGFVILHKNFRCRTGEIDIVARDGDTLVFVEVKYRKDSSRGYPEEAVSYYKQQKIIKTAQFYLCRYGISDNVSCRFDLLAIEGEEIRHIRNAFHS